MKVFYNPFTSNGGTGNVTGFERKYFYLIPAFILAVFIGFLLELLTVERLNSLVRLPLNRASHFHHHHFHQRHQQQNLAQQPSDGQQSLISTVQSVPESTDSTKFPKNAQNLDSKTPSWDKPNLFNISHFQFLRNNVSICQVDPRYPKAKIIPILVHTARSHFADRLTIRKSWGSLLHYKNWSIRLIFLIGEADRGLDPKRNEEQFKKQEALLDQEQTIFGDIVQGNFIDSYRNLTYKHMTGYRWILNFCTDAAFVMKVDDDMFIDVMQLINWRIEELKEKSEDPKAVVSDIYCNTFVGTKPQRCVGCKWFISDAEWPADFYPDYCSGWCYAITVDLVQKLYSVRDKAPFFWVDDVYTTGVLMEQLKHDTQNFRPLYKHLWGHVRTYDFRNFRTMCERNDMQMERKFGLTVPIPRGSNFERDMICLWNKTIYDDAEEDSKMKHKVGNDKEDDDKK